MAAEYPRWACPEGRPHQIVNNAAEEAAVMATAIKAAPVEGARPAPKLRGRKGARAS